MAEVKPLKLKVEKAQKVRRTLLEDPFVDVIVDLPFFHAEEVFTYKLIEESEGAQVGDLVGVPFGNGIASFSKVRALASRSFWSGRTTTTFPSVALDRAIFIRIVYGS